MSDMQPPRDERAILASFLDHDRAVAEAKALGLDRDGATRIATPSGLTVLGVVTHLTYVEGRWFRHHLRGDADVDSHHQDSFIPDPAVTVEAAVGVYRHACETSRAIAAKLPLETVCVIPNQHFGAVDLRWVLVHMVNETARHLGHLDVLRELTDGQTG